MVVGLRYAVVTGGNRGIGLEIVRGLAFEGITVVLTARDEKRGLEAVAGLQRSGLSNVVFHQLDVTDAPSVASLAEFIRTQFGWLDILQRELIDGSIVVEECRLCREREREWTRVNNAGVSGITADVEGLKALQIEPESWLYGKATKLVHGVLRQSPEKAQECFETNYYGVRRVTEALVPLLEKSNSGAKIVNVSSLIGELKRIPNEQIREEFGNLEGLTEEKLGTLLQRFINDLKDGSLEANGWPMMLPAYGISKTALNAYTRILARKFPSMCINCVHPGFVKTDLNWNTGVASVEEGAKAPIMVTLLPPGGPSGKYFNQMEIGTF